VGLQNADGGIPTFCKGWGRLPFDRSCPDLTAHAVRAMTLWRGEAEPRLRRRLDTGLRRALRYLERTLDENDTWIPLWFGNQWREDGCYPVYGTSRVVSALESLPERSAARLAARGRRGLLRLQNGDGGWGRGADGGSTIEETSLAVRALAGHSSCREPALRGAEWLIARLAAEPRPAPEPIGLYFASLWYAEELYPVIFAAGALGRLAACLEGRKAGRQRWVA
jgi:squalene-hopene/tetraprenyl-beta-curcumene cyclase